MKGSNITGYSQRGVSKLGLIVTLALVAAFLTVGLKIVPIYMEHSTISGSIESLLESGRANGMTQTQIRREISNSLRVNNIRDFDLNTITSSRANNRTEIRLAYEKRIHLFSNIDAVLSFDDRFE